MPDSVKPNKAESQMTLASSRSTSEDRRTGWWGGRTRLERALLLVCCVVLFVVVALCLSMAAVISGYANRNSLTVHRPVTTKHYTHKYKRSVPDAAEPNSASDSTHAELLLDQDLAEKLEQLSELAKIRTPNDRTTSEKPSPSGPTSEMTIEEILSEIVKSEETITKDASVDKTDASVDKTDASVDKTDASVDKTAASVDKTDASVDKTDASVDMADASVDKTDASIDKTDASVDKTGASDDKSDASVDKTDASVDKTDTSVDKTNAEVTTSETIIETDAPTSPETQKLNSNKPEDVKADSNVQNDQSSLTTGQPEESGICLTKGCVTSAAKLISNMDDKVDPCEDFFEYACGNFLRSKVIPDEKSSISQFSEVSDALQEKLRTLVEDQDRETDTPSSTMVKKLYKSCMDTESISKRGLNPLKEVLKQMGGWPAVEGDAWTGGDFDWTRNIYINRQLGYSVDLLFDFSITTNIKNSSWRIIDVDQPPLGMPSRKYLLKGLNDSDVQAYLDYQVSLAELLGADRDSAKAQLSDSLLFEIQIANFSLPKEERRNASKLYNKMTIRQLQETVPNVPWLEYINTILKPYITVNLEEEVIVNVPSYIQDMGKLLTKTPRRVISNYMMWRVAASSVSYLSEDARDLQLAYSKKITGTGKRQPRWKECMGAVSGSLSHAVGKLYAERFFKKEAKASADEMVSYIRAEFDLILRTVDWMDDETRVRAINKSLAITPHIAYPEELLIESKLTELYKGLEITDGELLSNMRNLTIFGTNYSFRRLREKVNKNDWKNHGAAAVVNAFYSPLENSIQFPAGILQGTFFDADRPKYLNYGAIGFVIGHEITHGFDDMGRQFDYKGDLKEWWEPETRAKFIEKSKCIIKQYGSFKAPEVNLTLNGVNTQGENIADNGGIKEAYYAYKQWAADNGKERVLPALGLSSKQLFWMSAANVWCGKYRPETLKLRILTGAHSPARFRVNGPLSNLPEFSQDWRCKENSKMNPKEKCTVW